MPSNITGAHPTTNIGAHPWLTEKTKGSEEVLADAVWQMSRDRHRNRINPAAPMPGIDEKP